MNRMKQAAVLSAVLLFGGLLTACRESSSAAETGNAGAESSAETQQEASGASSAADSQKDKPDTARTDSGAQSSQQSGAGTCNAVLNTAVCGKWEMQTYADNTVSAGQYGSEDYCRLYQLELFEDGTAAYYNRCEAETVSGTWETPSDTDVVLHFPTEEWVYLSPLPVMSEETDYAFTFADDTLTGMSRFDETLTFGKTEQFTERQYPETAWLTGKWVCDTEKSDADSPAVTWDISTIEQAVCAMIAADGTESELYFGQIQPDRTIRLEAEFVAPDDPENLFSGSVISRDGEEAIWKINANGYGTLVMKKAE